MPQVVYAQGGYGYWGEAWNHASLNYEFPIYVFARAPYRLKARAGLGSLSVPEDRLLGGLTALSLLTGRVSHHLEVTGGAYFGRNFTNGEWGTRLRVLPLIEVGYRYQEPGDHLVFRAMLGTTGLSLSLGLAF